MPLRSFRAGCCSQFLTLSDIARYGASRAPLEFFFYGASSDWQHTPRRCPMQTSAKGKPARLNRASMLGLLAQPQADFDAQGELCVLEGRLYLASLQGHPKPASKKFYVTPSAQMHYTPFCADFGPNNLGLLRIPAHVHPSLC